MKVHLGSGPVIKQGWVNLDQKDIKHPDFIRCDLRKGLPESCTNISYVYSSHFLEHLLWQDAIKLLKECHQKMLPGATMRVCLPNFRLFVTKYLQKDWKFFAHCRPFAPHGLLCEVANYAIYQREDGINAEHLCVYDEEFACLTLSKAGFRDCKVVNFDPSIDDESRRPYSLFVQGIK